MRLGPGTVLDDDELERLFHVTQHVAPAHRVRAMTWCCLVLSVLVAGLSLAGCASMTTTESRMREAMAVAYTTIEVAADTAARLHAAGVIDDDRRAATKATLQTALDRLDAARVALRQGDAYGAWTDAQRATHAVHTLLDELRRLETTR